MRKFLLILSVLQFLGFSTASALDKFPEVDMFEAYLYKDYSNITGDWALAFYNTEDTSSKLKYEIDIVSGDNNKIGGKYTVSSTSTDVNTCFVEIQIDGSDIIFTDGTLSITWVKTVDELPYYRFVGNFSDDDGNNVKIDETLPCNYSLNKFQYDLQGDYDITLYDDPAAEEASKPKPATGEVKDLRFTSDVRWQDQTAEYKYWQIEGYTADGQYLLDLSPYSTDHVAGAYSWSEFYPDYSRLVRYPDTENHVFINFQSGNVVVTEENGDVYVEGDLLGYDGIEYRFSISTDESVGIKGVKSSEVQEIKGSRKVLLDRGIVIERGGRTYGIDGKRQ